MQPEVSQQAAGVGNRPRARQNARSVAKCAAGERISPERGTRGSAQMVSVSVSVAGRKTACWMDFRIRS